MSYVDPVEKIADEARRYEQARRLLVAGTDSGDKLARLEISESRPDYPRWQSGVRRLDDEFGGFYGLTIVGGTPGTGKSTLALGSSLLAAESGIGVVYFDAENDAGLVHQRFRRWYGETEAGAAMERLAGYWHRIEIYPGAQLSDMIVEALRCFELRHHGLLLVLDSLNTLAEFDARTSQESFDSMRRLLFWLDSIVRKSHGWIRVLALSELNAGGELKGRKSGHTAQMVVRLEAEQNDNEVIRLGITKSRAGRSGDLGLFHRKWQTGRFEKPELAS